MSIVKEILPRFYGISTPERNAKDAWNAGRDLNDLMKN